MSGLERPGRFALAAVAVGSFGAVAFPGERVGLGALLVAVALAAVGAPFARDKVWAAFALAFAAVPLFRDALWVVLPSLGAAVVLGSLSIAGGRTWPEVLRGFVVVPLTMPWGPSTVALAARASGPPLEPGRLMPALRGIVLASGLVAVFGVLFASADEAFAQLAGDTLPASWDLGSLPGRLIAFTGVVAVVGAFARVPALANLAVGEPRRRLGATEWLFGLGALNALFGTFVAVQLAVLFGRHDHVLETAGLTYAEYARQGFGQLLLVAALTLAVAAVALRYGPGGRRPATRVLLGVLFALTFVVLASAWHRLGLYEEAYGATRLRVAAQWALLVVGALLAVVAAGLITSRFAWLPRATVLTGAFALLVLAAANPDRRIAERNLDRAEVDAAYLRSLSSDARPALPPRFDPPAERGDGWAGFSFAR